MILNEYQRFKVDSSDDSIFYYEPRFVYHLDLGFRNRLTSLYSSYLEQGDIVLDLMSSWVSHLPPNINFNKVIGHGMNNDELSRNKALDTFWVQDLNKNHFINLDTALIDKVLIVAGWQYLQFPELISKELYRVTKPGGLIIISFSNRAFWTKSPNIWVNSSDIERIEYIKSVLLNDGWVIENLFNEQTFINKAFNLIRIPGDPFFSVIAKKHKNN